MCLGQVFDLPSGTYNVSASIPTTLQLSCNSGYQGEVTFTCTSSFTWDSPQENCGRVRKAGMSGIVQIGCGATVITGVAVSETPFGGFVEADCPEGWLGEFNSTCGLRGEWETTSSCGGHCEEGV